MWCAIKLNDVQTLGQAIGFIYKNSTGELFYDKEAYPYLVLFGLNMASKNEENYKVSEEIMKTHVVSMFRYLVDQKDFCKMMGIENSSEYYKKMADEVEKNVRFIITDFFDGF